KKLIMLPSETMIWQPEFTDKTLSRKPGAVHSHFSGAILFRRHVPIRRYSIAASSSNAGNLGRNSVALLLNTMPYSVRSPRT
ncbi:hypothetical protein, partial [Escherichia coli]